MRRAPALPPTSGWSIQRAPHVRQPVRSSSQSPDARSPMRRPQTGAFSGVPAGSAGSRRGRSRPPPSAQRVEIARRGPVEPLAVGVERRVVARAVEAGARSRSGRPRTRGAGTSRSTRRRRPLRRSHAAPSSTSFSRVHASRWSATRATRFGSPSGSESSRNRLESSAPRPPRAPARRETHGGHRQRPAPDRPADGGDRLGAPAPVGLAVVAHGATPYSVRNEAETGFPSKALSRPGNERTRVGSRAPDEHDARPRGNERLLVQGVEGALLPKDLPAARFLASTPSASRRSRSTTPSTGCRRRSWSRAGRARSPEGFGSRSRRRSGSRTSRS